MRRQLTIATLLVCFASLSSSHPHLLTLSLRSNPTRHKLDFWVATGDVFDLKS